MKTYQTFLDEKKAFSPRGQAMREKKRKQNEKNRVSKQAADKGGAIVKHKIQLEKDKEESKREARQKLGSRTFIKPRGNPGQEKAVKANKEKEQSKKAALERLKKNTTGVGAGIKSALGGDIIGARTKGDREYDELVRQRNREKRGEFAKKKVQGVGRAASGAVKGIIRSGLNSKSQGPGASSGSVGQQSQVTRHGGGTKHF